MSFSDGFYVDDMRHLVCVPYSREALHAMALRLGIKRCWFHAGTYDHYDVPKTQVQRIASDPRVQRVSARQIVAIAKGVTA